MSKPLKIAYIIDAIETPSAGTEKQLLTMLRGLNRDRVQPYLVCLHDSEWMQSQQFDFPFINLNVNSLFGIPFLKGLRKFKQLHREEQFDIVQTFFKDGNIFGTFAARYAHCPIVVSSRRNTGYWHDNKHIKMLRFLRRWTTIYLANSQAAAFSTCEIEQVPREKTAVIYNALDLDRFVQFDKDQRCAQREKWHVGERDILVGAVANLRPVKKLDTLIDAAAVLNKEFANLKFVIVGEGPLHEELQQYIYRNGVWEIFKLAGRHDDIVPCLSAFDIGVLCSEGESFSNSLIEYMAAGLPVVASEVGGNSEAIEHKQTGLLYSIEDSEGLIGCLREIIQNPELADTLGKQAREKAFSSYERSVILKQHEDFYERLVRESRDEKNH